jgi:hypothetical protein
MARQFSDDEIREIGKHYGRQGRLPPPAFLQQVDCLQSAILRENLGKGADASKPKAVAVRSMKKPAISKERVAELIEAVDGMAAT